MQELLTIFGAMGVRDVFDILLVAVPFYAIFALLREARSLIALWGLILTLTGVLLIYLIAKVFDLQATALIYERFWMIVVLVFLIIFQGELKRGLTDVGRLRYFRGLFVQEAQVIDEIINAAAALSEKRLGALIVFERSNTLAAYLGSGTSLGAEVSSEMIRSIFLAQSPLHDGALIISGDRIVAGSCILPLTENRNLPKDLGTRHLSAIGLTEETDALVVVVSEETGAISLAEKGEIERFLSPEDLRDRLEDKLHVKREALREDEPLG